ncbi:MAG: DUF2711 family protein [Janthinobacterium lividum]
MEKRVLPEPDHFATCPVDGKILDYYRNVFEAAYVSLHPFIKPISISKTLFEPETYPDRATVAAHAIAVPWTEVVRLTGLPSIAAVDIGLKTGIGALRAVFAREDYADRLGALFESDGILVPSEGEFSDLVHDRVLRAIQSLGHQWVWIGDEFGTERKLYWIDDLYSKKPDATAGHCNVFTPDHSLLWTTHWDSHFSLICGSKPDLVSIVASAGLEGFYCGEETGIIWSIDAP